MSALGARRCPVLGGSGARCSRVLGSSGGRSLRRPALRALGRSVLSGAWSLCYSAASALSGVALLWCRRSSVAPWSLMHFLWLVISALGARRAGARPLRGSRLFSAWLLRWSAVSTLGTYSPLGALWRLALRCSSTSTRGPSGSRRSLVHGPPVLGRVALLGAWPLWYWVSSCSVLADALEFLR